MNVSWGSIFLLIAVFIFFCLAVGLFEETEGDIKVGYLGFFFTTLGILLMPVRLVTIGTTKVVSHG